MDFITQNINTYRDILSYRRALFEIVFFSILCFTMPFILTHPQWAIGTIVNAVLFRVAITQKGWKYTIPVIVLPNLGVITAGIIFGAPSIMLYIFAPLIWIGNFSYILFNKYFILQKRANIGLGLMGASLIKFIILFSSALIAVYIFNFPDVLLTTMGMLQIATALMGGTLAISYQKIEEIFKFHAF